MIHLIVHTLQYLVGRHELVTDAFVDLCLAFNEVSQLNVEWGRLITRRKAGSAFVAIAEVWMIPPSRIVCLISPILEIVDEIDRLGE